jgi:tetratricopeptide (TPR) repeat protein
VTQPIQLAKALTAKGKTERDLGHVDAALKLYAEAAAIYLAEGDALALAHTVRHLGDMQREQGRLDLAAGHYGVALNIYRGHERTPPLDLANAIRGLALLKDDSGQSEEAKLLWTEARVLYASVNVQAGVEESSRRLARGVSPTHPSS